MARGREAPADPPAMRDPILGPGDPVDGSVTAPPAADSPSCQAVFRIDDMDCAGCLETIRRRLESRQGVLSVEGSPVSRRLKVDFDSAVTDAEAIRREIGDLGYLALLDGPRREYRIEVWFTPRARRTYASGVLLGLGLVTQLLLGGRPAVADLMAWADPLYLAAAAVGGWNFIPKAVGALRGRILDMHVLMTLAVLGAVVLGEHFEAGSIAFLFSVAELLENFAVERASASVRALMEHSPETATIHRDGREIVVRASDVRMGDVVHVRPGERIPVDGIVIEGVSAVDESPITGEAMPVETSPGTTVYAGSIVHEGFLRVRSVRNADETTLARMIRLIEEAEQRRSPSERFVERFARIYTPAVTAGAILVVAIPVLVFGHPFSVWFLRGLTLLVIACPCALVISTPVSVVSAVTSAARQGVLIKGGRSLEQMGEISVMAFDKTGTLSHGRPEVAAVISLDGRLVADVLRVAAAVESRSEHPLAGAIVRAAKAADVDLDGLPVVDFESFPGRGARARVGDESVVVGRTSLLEGAEEVPAVAELVKKGQTTVLVLGHGDEGGKPDQKLAAPARLIGLIGLTDPVRPAASAVVGELRRLGIRRFVVLSGDHWSAVEPLGRAVGADEVRARLEPEDKVRAVEELEERYGSVAMVGDGVNDAPALASASVGIALGAAASDAALETADIALMGDDLEKLPYLYRLSRASRRVIRQNIAVAILLKAILAVGVPLGLVSLIVAVLVGDMGASLGVTANALRLAKVR